MRLPYMVCSIYWLLSCDEPLLESYDLLDAWEITVAYVCVNCLRVLLERPNTMNFQHVARTQWVDVLEWKPDSFVDLSFVFTIHCFFNILILVLGWKAKCCEIWNQRYDHMNFMSHVSMDVSNSARCRLVTKRLQHCLCDGPHCFCFTSLWCVYVTGSKPKAVVLSS